MGIDGNKIVDVNNLWVGGRSWVIVELWKGEDSVEVEGVKEDWGILYWREVSDESVLGCGVGDCLEYRVLWGNGDEIIGG